MLKAITVRAMIAAIFAGLSFSAHAVADSSKSVDIPAGALRQALLQVSEQFGADLVYSPEQIDGFKTGGAHGQLTTEQAVFKLLEGTTLELRTDPSGAILITPPVVLRGASQTSTNIERPKSRLRLAQVGTPVVFLRATETGGYPSEAADELQEVVVTGSLLRSGFNTPTPVTILGKDLIDKRAPDQVSNLLREIPALNTNTGIGNPGTQRNAAGQANVNFYGLNPARSLVLFDGRRQVSTNSLGSIDVDIVPTVMLERVETITGGASATYGADAVAGVANFITRDKLDGVKVNLSYGAASAGDKEVPSLGLGFGHEFGDRVSFVVGADLTKDTGIDSIYDRDWGRKEPGLFSYGNASAARGANPARLWVNNYELKTATGGGITTGCTPSPCPTSLSNIAFDDGGNPYQFIPGTTTVASAVMYGNTSNYGANPTALNQSLSAPFKRAAGLAKITFDVNEHAKLNLAAGYSYMKAESRYGPVQSTNRPIDINNPFLPASIRSAMQAAGVTSIAIGRINYDMGDAAVGQENSVYSLSVGISGNIVSSWSYDAYYKFSEADSDAFGRDYRTADVNAALSNCTVTTGASAGCVGYNPFGQGHASQAALDYVEQYEVGYLLRSKENVAQALVRGAPFSSWAGSVDVVAGLQYRKDALVRNLTDDSLLFSTNGVTRGFAYSNPTYLVGDRNVAEYFAETNIPLAKDIALLKSFSANLGYRFLDYSDNGGYQTWKAGLSWSIDDQLRLRATRSRDIRSPTLFEQYGISSGGTNTGVIDPRTGQLVNNGAPLPVFGRVATDLRPEVSMNTTVGIIYEPTLVSGLHMSLDYFRFDISDLIVGVTSQRSVDACFKQGVSDFCKLLTFDSTGTITSAASVNVNYNRLYVAGYNGEVEYKFPGQLLGGQWDVRGLFTYMDKYATTDQYTNTVYNDIGTAAVITSAGGSPRFQTNLFLTYSRGEFSTTASVRAFHGVKYSSSGNGILVGPDDPIYYSAVNSTSAAPCPGGAATCQWYQTAPNSISRNKFPGAAYLNWTAQYSFGTGDFWRELQVYAKVDDVLNKDPPEYSYAALGAAGFYDFVGRTYKVGFRMGF